MFLVRLAYSYFDSPTTLSSTKMAQRTSTRTASTDLTERPGKTTKASFEFGKLFEKPERWDQRHLSLLNIQEYRDASPVDMIGDSYLPGPDDRGIDTNSCL